MFEKFRPLGDRVFVKRLEGQEKTAGGIFIPDAAKEKAQTGAVLPLARAESIVPAKQSKLQVKDGDHRLFW